ncbi:MAG TPA: OPT/YSL family transporter, partial [Kofleriaceae bacterium]|nr:OPT/YSL family transporter [Kofleriaceae bacterium]
KYAPSPVAMGLAFVMSPSISITIAIGGFVHWFVARKSKKVADEQGVAWASALIGGEAIAGLLIAVLLLAER